MYCFTIAVDMNWHPLSRPNFSRVPNKLGGNLILFRLFFPPTCHHSGLYVYYISSCFINFQENIPLYTFIWNSCYIRNFRVELPMHENPLRRHFSCWIWIAKLVGYLNYCTMSSNYFWSSLTFLFLAQWDQTFFEFVFEFYL